MVFFKRLFFLIGLTIMSLIIRSQPLFVVDNIILQNVETELKIENLDSSQTYFLSSSNSQEFIEIQNTIEFTKLLSLAGEETFTISSKNGEYELAINPIPLWISIIPPLIAILLALVFKEVISSILIGIFSGAFIMEIYNESIINSFLNAFMRSIDTYLLNALNNKGHLSIILFSLLIGGMVGVISKNGGMQGVVNRIAKKANNAKNGQLATWLLGVAIFFDDYANTLVVGNTMRPVTDRLKISREKLAYIVDSTAAPMAAIAFITTWIGAELAYIESGINSIEGLNVGVYATFISSLAYSFYPILALVFILILIYTGRDFGPMYKAEKKAREEGVRPTNYEAIEEMEEFETDASIKPKAYNAVIPLIIVILGTIAGLIYTGYDNSVWIDNSISFSRKLSITIGNSDSYLALLWSSLGGLSCAIILSVSQKLLSLDKTMQSAVNGFKTMLPAIIILVLAWSLALIIEEMHTADFITSLLSESISPYLIPAFTFVLAAIVAFSTGSSWGTMAIIYPLMLPTAWHLSQANGLDFETSLSIFNNVVACVLAGAVLGDHCSPISDTTILSSLASSCDHISHVRTQMPYALTVGVIALLFGTLPSAFGLPFIVNILISTAILFLIVKRFGKK